MGTTEDIAGLSPVVFPRETRGAEQHRSALEGLFLAMVTNFEEACAAARTVDVACGKIKKTIALRARRNLGTEELRRNYRETREPVRQHLGRIREFQQRLEDQLAFTASKGMPELTDECRSALAALLADVEQRFAAPMGKLPKDSLASFQPICDGWQAVRAKILNAVQSGAKILPVCREELATLSAALEAAGARPAYVRT